MKHIRTVVFAAAASAALSAAAAAAARPSLREVPEIEDPLFAIVIAYVIGEQCPTLVAREMKGIMILQNLYGKARALGYSHKEIRAHVKSPVEKERMRAKGLGLLEPFGADTDPESYCALGRAEIEKKSAIGALLRAN